MDIEKWIVSEKGMLHAIYDHRPPGSPPWPRNIYPRDHAVACAQVRHLIDNGWRPPDDHPELGDSMDSTLREKIARELFGIWKEAKENTPEPWDGVQWDTLSEKHQREYLLTTQRVLALIRAEVERIDCPTAGDPYDDWCNGYEACRQAVLRALGEGVI